MYKMSVRFARIECWKMLVGHLAVWGWLLVACFAQNHTCPRVETVEEKVAVPRQEPVTYRSYTWCLKVPPRCSKYTVVTRERITYQIEVRNQTVVECCTGYVSLYGSCVAKCPECLNMQCDNAHNCSCLSGFTGPFCNITCEAGRWGNRCSEACVCRVGEDCDPISGRCTLSTTTIPPPTFKPKSSSTHLPQTTISPHAPTPKTTTNSFIDLTQTKPTTSTEDLTDFNNISKQKINDLWKLTNNNNDDNSLNIHDDVDYPVLTTESAVESFNSIQTEPEPKIFVENSLNVKSSVENHRWISELSTHSGITLGSALAIIILLIVTVSAVIHCRSPNKTTQQVAPLPGLVASNSLYAVPGPPTFSFIGGYFQENLARETEDDNYDHPRSVRCLIANEHVYDELKY